MNLILFYIHVNLYLAILWLAYRTCLSRSGLLSLSRYYLNGALLIAAALPFLHLLVNFGFQADLSAHVARTAYRIMEGEYTNPSLIQAESTAGLNMGALVRILLLTGTVLTLLLHLRNHFRLTSLRSSAVAFPHKGAVSVWLSHKISTPLIYRKQVFLPSSLDRNDVELVIAHESQHYQHRHHTDLLIYSLLNALFWMNPFFYLLRRELKMIHEYQVDREVISQGLDESSYKLSLIRLSVDANRFRMASGYSKTGLKKRIMMMNNNFPVNRKRILLSPVFLLLLGAVFMTLTLSSASLPQEKAVAAETQADSISLEIVEIKQHLKDNTGFRENKDLVILMNKNSRIMINGKKGSLEESTIVLRKSMSEKIAPYLNGSLSMENQQSPIFQVFFQKDKSSDPANFDLLMDEIGRSLSQSRKSLKQKAEGQTDIDVLLPFRVYHVLPDKNMAQH